MILDEKSIEIPKCKVGASQDVGLKAAIMIVKK
jgi:hypothetical protein